MVTTAQVTSHPEGHSYEVTLHLELDQCFLSTRQVRQGHQGHLPGTLDTWVPFPSSA